MTETLSVADQEAYREAETKVKRIERFLNGQRRLQKAVDNGDRAAQLSAMRVVADARFGMTGDAADAALVRECEAIARQLGYEDIGVSFRDPAQRAAKVKAAATLQGLYDEVGVKMAMTGSPENRREYASMAKSLLLKAEDAGVSLDRTRYRRSLPNARRVAKVKSLKFQYAG